MNIGNVDNLYFDVFNILGLELRDNKVFDIDKNSFLLYKGGFLIYGPTAIIHKRDTIFDCLHNYKLTEYLLQVLLSKEQEENGFYVQSYGIESTTSLPKIYTMYAITSKGAYESLHYYNSNLAIIDFMYSIVGLNTQSLHEYDYTKEEAIDRINNRNA